MSFNALGHIVSTLVAKADTWWKKNTSHRTRPSLVSRRDVSRSMRIPYPHGCALRNDLSFTTPTGDRHADARRYLNDALPRILAGLQAEVAALRASTATHSLIWDVRVDAPEGIASAATQVLATALYIVAPEEDAAGEQLVGIIFCTFIDTHFGNEVSVEGNFSTGIIMLEQL